MPAIQVVRRQKIARVLLVGGRVSDLAVVVVVKCAPEPVACTICIFQACCRSGSPAEVQFRVWKIVLSSQIGSLQGVIGASVTLGGV
jgi:hypothetical protein